MLNAIRNYAGSLVVRILFLLLVLSFVLWGIGDVFSPGRFTRHWIAKVGDITISPQAFSQVFDRTVRRISDAMGQPIDRSQAQALGLVDTVLNQLISQALLDQAAADLGIAAGDDAVRNQIRSDRRFRTANNEFDAETFRRTLMASGLTEAAYVQLLREDIVRRQLVTSVTALPSVPKPMLDLVAAYEGERRVGDYVFVAGAATPAPPLPDDAALADYHQKHAALFTSPEYRAVSAIVLRTDDIAKTISISDDDLHAAYDERAEEFTTPERRTFRQLVFPDQAAAQKAYDRLAQGASMASIATEMAGGTATTPEPIEVARTDLPSALADALFALAPGKLVGPIESPLGWHVIVLDSIKEAQRTPFEQAGERLKTELARDRATDALAQMSDRLDDVLGRGTSLEQAASELGLSVRHIEAIDADGKDRDGRPVADLLPNMVSTAFSTAEGTQSLLTEAGDEGDFVVRVDHIVPSALKPFETVRNEVAEAWRKDRITQLTKEKAEHLAEQVRGGRSLAEVAREASLDVVQTKPVSRHDDEKDASVPPQFVAALFAAKPGGAFVVAGSTEKSAGQYVGVLARVDAATPNADQNADVRLRRKLASDMQNDLLVEYLDALRHRYTVSVNTEALAKLF